MAKKHILSTIKPKDKNFSAADAVDEVLHWIVTEFAVNNCRQPSGSSQLTTNCTCVRFLANEDNERTAMYLAEYLVRYAGMSMDIKRDLLYDWVKGVAVLVSIDKNNLTSFMLPGIQLEEDDSHPVICRNALQGLLNEGRKSWKTAMKGPTFIHCNIGKKGIDRGRGKANIEVYISQHLF
jgi:hypothetical protein